MKLLKHPNFNKYRSTFCCLEKVLCVTPVLSMKKIQWQIEIESQYLFEIHKNLGGKENGMYNNIMEKIHQELNTSYCDLTINNKLLITDRKNKQKLSTKKKKGYTFVKPLDISKHADKCMKIANRHSQAHHLHQSQDWLFPMTVCNPFENMLQLHEMKNKKCNVLSIDQEGKEGRIILLI
ncbi:hypothetical protein RFI_32567 [Reticulomyxa filosa]|uniref:Uncharacterized protein n=1 Tax=Reticulomyxa filosa TaxID=46433 RepID=X6LT63_RETFI|nr:hypothetical protein RFI_32567 [Reticulomyxa filosa]|eukprot:ETO04829.1 hypothetical protein RFI_32567 [Reticulomyxa filosa]